jgi:hypothetical protein
MAKCNYAEKWSSAILEPLFCSISFLLRKLPLCLCTGCPPVHIHFNNCAPLLKGNTTTTLLAKIFWWTKQIKTLVWRNKIAQKLPDHHTVDRTRRWLPWMSWSKALATTSIRKRHKNDIRIHLLWSSSFSADVQHLPTSPQHMIITQPKT